ncbi:hypothetical protein MSAN_00643400 [Mycena sanguinolenta]|uniref:Uncharacterized protein n=1 Tax=Mycena sanguinolenta TaxID=230812 RepID=A0A8H6Z3Q9_9AGAR|nr:hypothetical protein MSAN_00643400 [Mycena sanguinolenta]
MLDAIRGGMRIQATFTPDPIAPDDKARLHDDAPRPDLALTAVLKSAGRPSIHPPADLRHGNWSKARRHGGARQDLPPAALLESSSRPSVHSNLCLANWSRNSMGRQTAHARASQPVPSRSQSHKAKAEGIKLEDETERG